VTSRTDLLVIGTGIAGMTLALDVADHAEVTLVTKRGRFESNTNYAQGGIAAVEGFRKVLLGIISGEADRHRFDRKRPSRR